MSFQTGIYFYLSCLLLQGIILQVQAQQGPVLKSSSGELCFGQTVTLTCTHPDPFQDLVKYQPVSISWAENGAVLDFSQSATLERFTQSRLNSTASTLTFTVTEEFHANRVINLSCFLTLNGGGREESDPPIIIDVNAQAQQGIVLKSSSGELCFGQTVTLSCTHPDPLQDRAKYQPELSSWAEGGVRLDFTQPANNERFTRTRPNSTFSTLSFTVTEDFHANRVVNYSCFLALTGGGGREKSDPPITIDVNETIQPPTLVSTPNSTSGLLLWNSPSSSCSNYQYSFTLNWTRIEDSSTGTVSTAENRYTFTINGSYTVSITATIADLNLSESEPLIVDFPTPVTEPSTATELPGSDYIAYLAILPVAILLLLPIPIVVVIYCVRRNRKKRVSHSHSADATELVQPPLEFPYVPDLQALGQPPLKKEEAAENEYGEAPSKKEEAEAEDELGQTRQELDKKQEAENDQVQYAAIDFSGPRPMAPPSLETVVYTQTVEQFRNARKNRPIPPLPPAKTEEEEEEERKLAQEAVEITADFKAQVVAILQASKLVYRTLDPKEPVVGTYQDKTFVASFVHAPGGKEILSSEVEAIIKDRKLQSTDKGFLVATTDSISGPWLEHLEKHNCHFIGLSRKGGVKKEMLLKKLSFCFPESSSF